jgi:hypothetical protein
MAHSAVASEIGMITRSTFKSTGLAAKFRPGWYYRSVDRPVLFAVGFHLASEPSHVDIRGSFDSSGLARFDRFDDDSMEAGFYELPNFGGIAVLMTTVLGSLLSIILGWGGELLSIVRL